MTTPALFSDRAWARSRKGFFFSAVVFFSAQRSLGSDIRGPRIRLQELCMINLSDNRLTENFVNFLLEV